MPSPPAARTGRGHGWLPFPSPEAACGLPATPLSRLTSEDPPLPPLMLVTGHHPPLASDGFRDDTGDPLCGGEICGEPVLGQRERDAGRGIGVGEAPPYSSHPEHGRPLLRIAPEPADRVTQRPRHGVAHDLVRTAERRRGDFTQPLG